MKMSESPSKLSPRDAALWRVGRNLHRFQVIEALLKSMLPSVKLSGTHQQIERQIRNGKRALKRATLGTLTDFYAKDVLTPRAETEEPEVGSEVLFSFSISVDAPPETLRRVRSEWKRITKERNCLAHSTLLANGLASDADCIAFCQQLDDQYDRAGVLLDELTQQEHARHMAATAFKQLVESGQLDKLLHEPPSDA